MRRRWSKRVARPTWWQLVSVLSLLAVVAAVAGVIDLQREIRSRTLHSVEVNAQLISALILDPILGYGAAGVVVITDATRIALDSAISEFVTRGQLAGLDMWNANGQLMYHAGPLPSANLSASRLTRVLTGRPVSTVNDGNHTVEVYIPYGVATDGTVGDVVNVSLPADPVDSAIDQATQLLYGGTAAVAVIGGLLLFAARRRHLQERRAARSDPLTGLGNRLTLAEQSGRMLDRARPGRPAAVLLLDLDRFKDVNDTLGHHAGDELLVEVAARLRSACRAGDIAVRLGGDEFAVLLPDLADQGDAREIAERMLHALRTPIMVSGLSVEVGGSIGIAFAPDHGTDAATLLRCADVAMYEAKSSGGSTSVYDPATDTRDAQQLTVLAELRQAIPAGQLRLYYQPKANSDQRVPAVEALIRWQHPQRGLLGPDLFIPLAEHTVLIHGLTEWVLTEAAAQCARWQAAGQRLRVAVNVSPRSLLYLDFPAALTRAAVAAGVPVDCLEIEITESAVMADPRRTAAVLDRLKQMGVRIAIDDFGTGYTSLSLLTTLPVDTLKIDRVFIADLLTNPAHLAVTRHIIQLAENLGLGTVAEGVETPEVWQAVIALGCDQIQGYLLTPPLPPDKFLDWLRAHDERVADRRSSIDA